MPQRLDNIASEFRSAILAGDHTRAARLIAEYVEAVRQIWELLPGQERAASEIPVQARQLLAWATDATIAQRRLTSAQLEMVQISSCYRRSAPVKLPSRAIEVRV